jgi:hypothetical protein
MYGRVKDNIPSVMWCCLILIYMDICLQLKKIEKFTTFDISILYTIANLELYINLQSLIYENLCEYPTVTN